MPPSVEAIQPQPDPQHERAMADRCDLNTALLRRVGAQLGFEADLSAAAVARFERYASEIVVANAGLNLTRITRPDEIAIRHFLDSLICLRGLGPLAERETLRLIDVGAGAGLPGLALKLVRPGWQLSLAESVGKKARFLEGLVAQPALGLAGTRVLCARAEDLGRAPEHRAAYDLALARAVAALPTLVEYLLPLLRVGGRALALKGAEIGAELDAAAPAIEALGGRLVEAQPYRLPGLPEARHLIVIEKRSPTPERYPRRAGLPARSPIGAG